MKADKVVLHFPKNPKEFSLRRDLLACITSLEYGKHQFSLSAGKHKIIYLEITDYNGVTRLEGLVAMLGYAMGIDSFDPLIEGPASEIIKANTLEECQVILNTYANLKNDISVSLASVLLYSTLSIFEVNAKGTPETNEWLKKARVLHESSFKTFKNLVSLEPEVVITDRKVIINESCIFHARKVEKVVLPKKGEENILITSALPYVNNVPHLGNIIGCVLSADVFARYCRLKGRNTIYICGTDEYGTATETKALEEGVSCQALCDKYSRLHGEIYEWFQISFDKFGRTSTPKQTQITQEIFQKLRNNNFTTEETVQQLFCETCSRFLADRYVEGECPLCGYEDARGDQCDACQKLLNAADLINPRCKMDKNRPVIRESKHLFIKLPELQDSCAAFVENSSVQGKWSSNSISTTKAWLREGLKNRCITRDLKWGTPVPVPGYENKVFYVWFDAPIGYLSITANYTDEWEKWWKNPSDVKLYQFMGKDNIPFHTVIFPCSLLGTKDDYTMLHHLSTTEYLNYENGKFSKSRGVGVFGNNVMSTGIPCSVWRYYLLINRPETDDSVFLWEDLATKTNTELLANLGNLVNRSTKFLKAKFASVLPDYHETALESDFIARINKELSEYNSQMDHVKLKGALRSAMAISALANLYLTESKLDNNLYLKERERCGTVLHFALNIVYLLSALLSPFIPETSEAIAKQLNAPARLIPATFGLDLLAGHVIGVPFLLFQKLEDEQISQLRAQFSG